MSLASNAPKMKEEVMPTTILSAGAGPGHRTAVSVLGAGTQGRRLAFMVRDPALVSAYTVYPRGPG